MMKTFSLLPGSALLEMYLHKEVQKEISFLIGTCIYLCRRCKKMQWMYEYLRKCGTKLMRDVRIPKQMWYRSYSQVFQVPKKPSFLEAS